MVAEIRARHSQPPITVSRGKPYAGLFKLRLADEASAALDMVSRGKPLFQMRVPSIAGRAGARESERKRLTAATMRCRKRRVG